MITEGQVVGVPPQYQSPGTPAQLSFDAWQNSRTINSGAFYQEAARLGQMFSSHTAATGVAPGTALGTTAAFALQNPKGSGTALVIVDGSLGYVSGTLGAGFVSWCVNNDPSKAVATGTAITPLNNLVGAGAGKALAFTTATLPATPTLLRPFCSIGASLATTAVQPWQIVDYVDGKIVVLPGCCLSLEATAAAGTTPLVVYGCTWIELPLGTPVA